MPVILFSDFIDSDKHSRLGQVLSLCLNCCIMRFKILHVESLKHLIFPYCAIVKLCVCRLLFDTNNST